MKIRLNEPRLRKAYGVQIYPGLQSVTDEQWSRMKRHPSVKAWLDKGIVEEVKAKPGRPSAEDLASEAAETFDMERLQELAADKRKTVSDAAQAQIDKINAQG